MQDFVIYSDCNHDAHWRNDTYHQFNAFCCYCILLWNAEELFIDFAPHPILIRTTFLTPSGKINVVLLLGFFPFEATNTSSYKMLQFIMPFWFIENSKKYSILMSLKFNQGNCIEDALHSQTFCTFWHVSVILTIPSYQNVFEADDSKKDGLNS